MRVLLTRHFRTRANADGRILGWSDSEACDDARADIDFVESRLHEQNITVDEIFSSDLRRSVRTAKIHAGHLGLTQVTRSPAFNEINYGRLQTLEKSEVPRLYPQHKKDPDFVYPDGESFRQMQERSVAYLNSLVPTHADKTILIVAHAGVIRGLVSHLLNLDFGDQLRQAIPFRYIGDFQMDQGICVNYAEHGELSGFVVNGVVELSGIDARSGSLGVMATGPVQRS